MTLSFVGCRLAVARPTALQAFYRDKLGMAQQAGQGIGYGGAGIALAFLSGQGAYRHHADDVYWKIGITLPDVDLARRRLLLAQGAEVDEGRQFLDIGYLSHLEDPAGFRIELLQHRFETNHRPYPEAAGLPLGQPAAIGQVTLRVRDIEASLAFYRDRIGLKLLSVQEVPPRRFTLYFLAATEEEPPLADLAAVGNREWLWQRPYTTLELLHRWDRPSPNFSYRLPERDGLGFRGLVFEDGDRTAPQRLNDPDGVPVEVVPPGAPQGRRSK